MPCDSVITVTVEFHEATDLKALKKSLEEAGFESVQITGDVITFYKNYYYGKFIDGKFEVPQYMQGFDIEQIKVGYARNVLKQTAQKYGWNVQPVEVKEKVRLW